jgi:CO dehydrogenase maturation factor
MARLLARAGRSVLAIDGDSNPNLALTLGVPGDAMGRLPTLSRDLLRRTAEGAPELTATLDEICRTHAVEAPDGVTLLVMAHPQHAGTG